MPRATCETAETRSRLKKSLSAACLRSPGLELDGPAHSGNRSAARRPTWQVFGSFTKSLELVGLRYRAQMQARPESWPSLLARCDLQSPQASRRLVRSRPNRHHRVHKQPLVMPAKPYISIVRLSRHKARVSGTLAKYAAARKARK